jgi:glycosyltransferase involved in cell wall biosynthesis
MAPTNQGVAVIIPCHNEEAAIGTVVRDLKAVLPDARIYVYDNASTDRTAEVAVQAGALVRHEPRRGTGTAVRRAFADIDADIYVLIDGDDTYDAKVAGQLVETLISGPYDHVLGVRRQVTAAAYRRFHLVGNGALNMLAAWIFNFPATDMLSGNRAFSRRFVKSFPALSREFEIETELTIHAFNLGVPQGEVEVGFKNRPLGGTSKLRTYRDGLRILWWILTLAWYERPLLIYGSMSALLFLTSLALGIPVVLNYIQTGFVARFPTAILASSLVVLSTIVLAVGVILGAVRHSRNESRRLAYLSYAAVTR